MLTRWGIAPTTARGRPAFDALEAGKAFPAIGVPAETRWVKRVKMESQLPTAFRGHPFSIGAADCHVRWRWNCTRW
jgi:hypothetical protein